MVLAMSDWKSLCRSGNEAFKDQCWQVSEQLYQQALDEVSLCRDAKPGCAETTLGWVAVHHNFSALYERLGDSRRAFRHLMEAHKGVLSQWQQARNEAEKYAARASMHHTLQPLLAYAKEHPLCHSCHEFLAESQALLTSEPRYH